MRMIALIAVCANRALSHFPGAARDRQDLCDRHLRSRWKRVIQAWEIFFYQGVQPVNSLSTID
jgi:hypothetical protein